ncbi:MAG: DegT/DnrJ/EryC1/StrS family aminotransferase [Bdellovibrionales bacterium]|nr:DegT/DnrJ/EryC1/StrS family aminotransferase [Bdellovibrionales bacterium]
MEKIPFMDLAAQNKSLESELNAAIAEVVQSRSFIQGAPVERFNKDFLRLHGGTYGVGCANGTGAITVALRALNVGHGDEVLVPNHTFIATAEAVVEVGAKPVLVEIDSEYRQLDLKDAARRMTAKTKAILPVHLYGLPEPMDQVMAFAREHKLKVVEDCAQAQLAKWKGQAVGTFGDLATFSFYPGKNLGAFGDAGFILTENAKHFEFIERYINHGRQDKYLHQFFGSNYRMDGLQGAVLATKVTRLAAWTERRREVAKQYDESLKGFRVLQPRAESVPVYHLYVVEVSNRQEVMDAFKRENIDCGIHYPIPLSCQPAFAPLGYKEGQFPVSEEMSARILSLPFFPEMTVEQMKRVVGVFRGVAKA